MKPETDPLAGDLASVQWNVARDDFDFAGPDYSDIRDEIPELQQARPGMDREEFDRMVGPERFADAMARAVNWHVKVRRLEGADIDADDPGYRAAAAVIYERVLEGPGRHILPYLSNRDLVDLWKISFFVVPYANRYSRAVARKKKAARASADAKPATDNGGAKSGEQ